MKIKLTTSLLATIATAGVSVAIAGLKDSPPKNVDLTALWKINPEESDDPQKVIAKKRKDSDNGRGNSRNRGSGGGNPGTDVGDVFGGVIFGGVIFGGGAGAKRGGDSDRPDEDPAPQQSMRVPLDSFLATREQFEIEQQPDELTIRDFEETSTCKPGELTKVPLQSGELVEQRCGWDGDVFVMELMSPDGVKRAHRYELRNKDKQLVVTSQVKGGSGHLADLRIRRVYDRIVAF